MYSNGQYLKNNPSWHQEDSLFKAESIINILIKNNISFRTIAEAGCGAGEILKNLASRLPNVMFSGFDISTDVSKLWVGKEQHNLRFNLGDIALDSRVFDVLIVADVFEHVADYLGFIKTVSGRANYIVFHVPLDMSVQKLLRPKTLLDNRYIAGHLHYFCKETALATLIDCDLEIVDYFFTKWGLQTKQKTILKQLGKIPLLILDAISTDLAARILGGNSLLVLTKKR